MDKSNQTTSLEQQQQHQQQYQQHQQQYRQYQHQQHYQQQQRPTSRQLEDQDSRTHNQIPVNDINSSTKVNSKPITTITNVKQTNSISTPPWSLRYRKRTICLLFIYVPLLVIPWIFTCLLSVRPLNHSSYTNQFREYSISDSIGILKIVDSIKILNTITSLITIPLLSSIIAQAAVVYTQRRKQNQFVSILQTFNLADRGWEDLTILSNALIGNGNGGNSLFLWYAAGILFLGIIQQPLRTAFVNYENFQVPWCANDYHFGASTQCNYERQGHIVGFDPEPSDLQDIPIDLVLEKVIPRLSSLSDDDYQARLWPENGNSYTHKNEYQPWRQMLSWYESCRSEKEKDTYFVSNLINGTTTGVLREHAIRLNSTIKCTNITQSTYPTTCPGSKPFSTKFSQGDSFIKVCVPGNSSQNPFQSHRNRQDIKEEFFLDVKILDVYTQFLNFTMHCEAGTSRGYFELGNYQNDNKAGPLLDKWPNSEILSRKFSDYFGHRHSKEPSLVPLEWDQKEPDEPSIWPQTTWTYQQPGNERVMTPGPLTISAMALFGNNSIFNILVRSSNTTYPSAFNQICQQGGFPLRLKWLSMLDHLGICYAAKRENDNDNQIRLQSMLSLWIKTFKRTENLEMILDATMFVANEVVLTETAKASKTGSTRHIWTSPGMIILKPKLSNISQIFLSVLLAIHLCSLLYLIWYIYQVPTWTHELNSMSIVAMVNSIEEFKDIKSMGYEDLKKMKRITSIVGVVQQDDNETLTNNRLSKSTQPILAVGALGPITRRVFKNKEMK